MGPPAIFQESANPLEKMGKHVFGQITTPTWTPRTIEFIWVRQNPPKPNHKIIPPQNSVFRSHVSAQKGPRAKMSPNNQTDCRFWTLFHIASKGAHSQS